MVIRKVKREIVNKYSHEVWNAYVDLLAMEGYEDLDDVQKPAHLCFWYDSEVQNGGHLQYFENHGTNLLHETLQALNMLGARCQRQVLDLASQRLQSRERRKIETVKQFVSAALDGEFDEFDSKYHECTPEITTLLEDYLSKHQKHFVEIEE